MIHELSFEIYSWKFFCYGNMRAAMVSVRRMRQLVQDPAAFSIHSPDRDCFNLEIHFIGSSLVAQNSRIRSPLRYLFEVPSVSPLGTAGSQPP
jgi:hypothetical protein